MNESDIANILIDKLLNMGFIVHRYNAYSSNSIYLKLDYGLSCGIRISNHPGKKKYSYRFNVIKDYKDNKVVIKDGLICYFYNFNELNNLLDAIQKEKQEKIKKYGIKNYYMYMEREKSKNKLFDRFNQMKGETK